MPSLAHFTHIPWVGPEAWSVLPEPIVRAIHEGLLASDVAGFHTERWRRAFLVLRARSGSTRTSTRVTAHPISIDPGRVRRASPRATPCSPASRSWWPSGPSG